MKKLSFWLLTATLLLAGTVRAQFTLSGTLYDENEKPLPNVNLRLDPGDHFTASDSKGHFIFKGLASQSYTLLATSIGYDSLSQPLTLRHNQVLTLSLISKAYRQNELVVKATRAGDRTPTAFQNISKAAINQNNFGQDLPILLNGTPSAVTTSDAGAGVGYTGIRIRGSDATRINVTINGVPLNDAESQGAFWVNLPDFASSLNSVQIQRGVGTSTNGAGAFGASINLQSISSDTLPYAEFNNSIGSYNTQKNTLKWGTGTINKHWRVSGRLSRLVSDGYIDRAFSNLQSFYLSGKYVNNKTTIEALSFGGKEKTYQSWYGTPESRVKGDTAAMRLHALNNYYTPEQTANLLNAGRTYNYYLYNNETDNYWQNHYQLHGQHKFSNKLVFNAAAHYTRGKGYYEQYKTDQSFADYGAADPVIGGDTISSTNLVRQRWLDNHFYGLTGSLLYKQGKLNLIAGGAWNVYRGRHFGEVIWAELAQALPKDYRYYLSHSYKRDANGYLKADYSLSRRVNIFGDIQLRSVAYSGHGGDQDNVPIGFSKHYLFVNPKAGIYYARNRYNHWYGSVSVGNREPVRSDFTDNAAGSVPKPERLTDFEAGYKYQSSRYAFNINAYMMDYKDQLVVTGELNDVGSNLRKNVDKSYRAGVELMGTIRFTDNFKWDANLTLSDNRIKSFKETVYNYDSNTVEVNTYNNVAIAMSPSVIGFSSFTYTYKQVSACLMSKYVGKQYLDNTGHSSRSIGAYFTNDVRLSYSAAVKGLKSLQLSLLVNNVLGTLYSSNGYTYSYIAGGSLVTENFYYPQAPANFLLALSVAF